MMNLKKLHNNWRKATLLSACFVLAVSVLPACKKKTSPYGTEALNVDDILASGGKDTFQLKTSSILFDTIPTDNQLLGVLGAYHDPKLGIVNASIYTQMTIGGKVSFLPGSLFGNIDSVVLGLKYASDFYGKLDPQTFEVYQLADTMSVNSVYRRNSTEPTMGSNLVLPGSETQTPRPGSDAIYDSDSDGDFDTLGSELRLRLDNALGQQFITDILAGNSAFESGSEFLNSGYFKGFRINVANGSPAPGKGAVLYFNLANSQSKLTIYFKLANETNQRQVTLIVNNSCADFNHVEISNSGLHIADVIANPLSGQTQFYSQSFYTIPKIEMPTLTTIPSNALINNAVIYLPVAHQTGSIYNPTQTFRVAYGNEDGTFTLLGLNGSIMNTTYDKNQKAYVFDLRHYIQELVSRKKPNTALYLIPPNSSFNSSADRVIFNGPASSYKTKPKLVIKYTEFN